MSKLKSILALTTPTWFDISCELTSMLVSALQLSEVSISSTACSNGIVIFFVFIPIVERSVNIKFNSISPSKIIFPFSLFSLFITVFISTSTISPDSSSGTFIFSLILHRFFLHCLFVIVLTMVLSKFIFSPGQYIS